MWQGEMPCRMIITKCGSVPCEPRFGQTGSQKFVVHLYQVQVSDNHGVRKWTFLSSKQPTDNQAVRNWISPLFRFKFLTTMESGSEHSFPQNNPLTIRQSEIGCFEVEPLRSSQSGWLLRQSWCHEPGNPPPFLPQFLTNMLSESVLGFAKPLF